MLITWPDLCPRQDSNLRTANQLTCAMSSEDRRTPWGTVGLDKTAIRSFRARCSARMVRMGNAPVGASNVAAQRLRAAGKAERNVIRKRFANDENDSGSPTELRMLTSRMGFDDERAERPSGLGEHQETAHEVSELSGSFIGPDLRRHYAPIIFSSKMNAERWLSKERDYKERCEAAGETWKPPAERKHEKKAEVLPLSKYGKTVIDQRILRPRTRIEYESKWFAVDRTETGQARGTRYHHNGGSGVVRRSGFG